MNRGKLLLLFVFIANLLNAQRPSKGTYSFYSIYGLGERTFMSTVEGLSMGGVSANIQNPMNANIQNPASYPSLKATNISVGVNLGMNNFTQGDKFSNIGTSGINNLNIGFSFLDNKMGVVFGIYPYSSMGYESERQDNSDTSNIAIDKLEGFGELNSLFIGTGYSFSEGLNIGVNINYIFGNKNRTSSFIEEASNFGSLFTNNVFMKGVKFDLGVQGKYRFNKKLLISYGSTVKLGGSLSAVITNKSETFNKNTGNSLESDGIFEEEVNEDIRLNNEYTFALGIGDEERWMLSAQYYLIDNNSNKDILNYRVKDVEFVKGNKWSFGGYFTPTRSIYKNYFLKITYRAGYFIEKKDFAISGENLYDKGFTLGVHLPFKSSGMDIGFVKGDMGSNNQNLIKDNYWKVYLSINFNDRWFVKQKYD